MKNTPFEIVMGTLMACVILYGSCYALPREFIKATREAQKKPSPIHYERENFHKVVLEGHEYWCVENYNHLGFCHSESCPCKTNKTEVAK